MIGVRSSLAPNRSSKSSLPRLIALALLGALGAGCDSGGSDSPTAPPPPRVSAAVAPNPIVARVCSCGPLVGELDFDAELLLTESAGSPSRIERLALALRADAANRLVGTLETTIEAAAGLIPAGGTLRLPFAFHFPGADAALPGTLEVTASLVDSAGNRATETVSVRVLPPG